MSAVERDLTAVDAAVRELRLELDEDDDGQPRHPYRMTRNGIWWLKADRDRDDPVPVRLTNFQARIVRDIVEDDGLETRHLFEVEGRLTGRDAARQSVPAAQFASLNWVLELLGAGAIIESGNAIKDRARAAIQYLSQGAIARAHVYTHTGWHRLAGGQHVYLHAGGAIGAQGTVADVEVAPPTALARYRLPDPPSGDAERAAVLASLDIADPEMAPDRLTIPVLAAAYRAPLGPTDMSLVLIGESGLGKSELAALAQQHFGPELDRMKLPANFQSTANFNLGIAFAAKDALLVVDEFKPAGNRIDRQRAHAEANRLLTAQGNLSGRGRADTGGSPRAIRDPRGLLLITGEEVPEGYSARARALILEVSVGDVEGLGVRPGQPGYRDDRPRLTRLQHLGRQGAYALAMAGYLRWLADSVERLPEHVRREVAELRNTVRSGHARTGNNVGQLMVGVACFLEYARSIEALTAAAAEAWRDRAWAALLEAAARQEGHHRQARPEQRFLELLMSAIGSGRAHVADRDGLPPDNAEAWGWRSRLVGAGQDVESRLEAQGARVGWLSLPEGLFLDRAAAFRAAAEMDAENGIGVSAETLAKRLHQAGHLASVSSETEGRLAVRRRLEGSNRRVLHLHATVEGVSYSRQTGNTGNVGNRADQPNTNQPSDGSPAVPGSASSGLATGNTTGNAMAAKEGVFPVAVPGRSLKEGRPGTEGGPLEARSELESEAPLPVIPVFPVCRANESPATTTGTDGHREEGGGDA
ncbi:MAG TPA: hypothetical protein VIC57_19575 [Candidatus Dormibacteraeota bacterium]